MTTPVILATALGYLFLLFLIAYYADRRAERGHSLIRNPYVYTLSIAVYCTSWTFYGAVGSAARGGLEFATIYLGPTLVFLGWWVVLRKIVRISKMHRLTSIADFVSSRYGKSTRLGVLVTLIAVVGTVPYFALQLKAVATSFNVLTTHALAGGSASAPASGAATGSILGDTALWVAVGMAVFVILFGTRNIDADEHHEGVVAAIAFESFIKLSALIAVGLFVVFGLYAGFGDLFAQAQSLPNIADIYTIGDGGRWITLMLLAMAAAICLPRQFQIVVVENVDERHLATASWLFPLYLLAISLFALPIGLAGLQLLPPGTDPDFFVLTLPMVEGWNGLALLAFIGGLSSATSMVIVAAIALSTMLCNDLVMPALLKLGWLRLRARGEVTGLLLTIRRVSIVCVFALGFTYYRLIGEGGALAAIGLISFAAVAQFMPVILGGLFWKGGNRQGAQAGLVGGFIIWTYTLLLPSFAQSGWLDPSLVTDGPYGIELLRPEALFGLTGWDPLAHALFWSMFANIGLYVMISLFSKEDTLERLQAALFVDVFRHPEGDQPGVWKRSAAVEDLYELVQRFLGRERAYAGFRDYARSRGLDRHMPTTADADLIAFVERLLAGSLGAASARVIVGSVAKGEMPRIGEVMQILEETHQAIAYSHRLEEKSRQLEATAAELRRANERLQELDKLKDDFLTTVSHELRTPLTSIRSFSEILVDADDLPRDKQMHYLNIIASESQRLTRLIDDILDLARLEQGSGEWRMSELDPAMVLQDAVATADGLTQQRNVRLESDIKPAAKPVYVDPDRLMQVYVNLLSNAVKYSHPISGWVRVEGLPTRDGYHVVITDNGAGIPEEERKRVFDKFARAAEDMANRPQGSGLGLAITRQIIDHFGGQIWIDAPATGGTAFHLHLPAAKTEFDLVEQRKAGE